MLTQTVFYWLKKHEFMLPGTERNLEAKYLGRGHKEGGAEVGSSRFI